MDRTGCRGLFDSKELVVVSDWVSSDVQIVDKLKSLIDAVIIRNASTLTTIDMKCNSLPFDHKPKLPVLVYGKLQNLICSKR